MHQRGEAEQLGLDLAQRSTVPAQPAVALLTGGAVPARLERTELPADDLGEQEVEPLPGVQDLDRRHPDRGGHASDGREAELATPQDRRRIEDAVSGFGVGTGSVWSASSAAPGRETVQLHRGSFRRRPVGSARFEPSGTSEPHRWDTIDSPGRPSQGRSGRAQSRIRDSSRPVLPTRTSGRRPSDQLVSLAEVSGDLVAPPAFKAGTTGFHNLRISAFAQVRGKILFRPVLSNAALSRGVRGVFAE